MTPLTIVSSGKIVKIVSLMGGKGIHQHLIGMGLDIGSEIEVIHQGVPGPFIVGVKETRLAIGAGMAQKIMVDINDIK